MKFETGNIRRESTMKMYKKEHSGQWGTQQINIVQKRQGSREAAAAWKRL